MRERQRATKPKRTRAEMNKPIAYKITPNIAQRISDLHDLNWTSSRICRDLAGVVSAKAIEAHRKAKLVPGPPRKVGRPPANATVAPPPPSAPVHIESAAARLLRAGEALLADPDSGASFIARRLRETSRLVDLLSENIEKGSANAQLYGLLVNIESRLAERVEAMRPKPPPDPDSDPANIEATARLVGDFERLVRIAEERGKWVPLENRR